MENGKMYSEQKQGKEKVSHPLEAYLFDPRPLGPKRESTSGS